MRRRAKAAKAKVDGKRSATLKSPKSDDARVGDLEERLAEAHREVAEAREQQTATGEILRVISSSPADVEPVLAAILDSGRRLCDAEFGAIFRFENNTFVNTASTTITSEFGAWLQHNPIRPGEGTPLRRVAFERRPVQVADILSDPGFAAPDEYRREGMRTALAVPMVKDGALVGALTFHRRVVKPFTDQQIALLETFAAQAVIAIENVRLFKELQENNRALTGALDRQTATGDVLRIIAQSPTELQPVLEAIAASAVRLCSASDAVIERLDGDRFYNAAHAGSQMKGLVGLPVPLTRRFPGGRAVLDRQRVIIDDIQAVAEREYPDTLELLKLNTIHSVAEIPLLSEGKPLGTIAVLRGEVRPFTDTEIALLETFADQAVIAIENVRLFKELESSNRELRVALEQQTATSELLKVIGRSTFDLQPVFETLAENAVRLCEGNQAFIFRFDGQVLRVVALHNVSPELRVFFERNPVAPGRGSVAGRAALERRAIHIHDVRTDPERTWQAHRVDPIRTVLTIPMLRGDEVLGVIGVNRLEVRPFSDSQIALLETFADQAAIAIENARLLTELQARTQELTRSVGELRALGEVSQAVSSTLDLGNVLETIVSRAVQLSGSDQGIVYEFDERSQIFHARATHRITPKHLETVRTAPIRLGEGAIGRAGVIREPVQVVDTREEGQLIAPQVRELLLREGMRSLLAVPLVREHRLLGGLVILRREPGAFATDVVGVLQTFATQSVLAIQNARLFRELGDKSRQLEVASQHKSEFLANMSHELRTPLNAVIGFSEVLLQRMFGDLNPKQDEYLKDIYASGQHLLSLINDILDLSKIEAGRMELAPAPFHLPSALENAVTLIKERAARHGITLRVDVDPQLGEVVGDERKVKQVVLNLLSNAVKFTPEGGGVSLKAARRDGVVEIAVMDTGIGIDPEDQAAIFEEFRQVGSDERRKQEGTGLGLTLAKKFVELHGGRIWVESAPGRGSTFTFTLPVA